MALTPSDTVKQAFHPVVKAIEEHAHLVAGVADLVALRPGYVAGDPARPALVLAFRPPMPAHADKTARDLATRAGVAVWATEASPEEQLRWMAAELRPQRDPNLERWYVGDLAPTPFPIRGSYEPPNPPPSLDPVEARMRVTLCASPDAGWPVLREFLSASISRRLVVGMYHFTAPHVYDALRKAVVASSEIELHMVRHPSLGEGGAGVKVDDLDGEVVITRLRRALGDRFEFAKTTTGKSGIFGTAYHIKVAVADGKRFWLSSGNWQSSNLPPFDPVNEPEELPSGYLRKYNREYHAVVEHAGLAKTLEKYLEHDLASAQTEPASFTLPDVAVPIEEELPEDFAPAQYFEPLTIDRKVKVQPILTPDNYAPEVLALIQRAQTSIWFQNQYISLLDGDGFEEFDGLVQALLAKQQAGLDVRIICRNQMEAKKVDLLIAAGFDAERIKFQTGCHNKTIIVDGREVLFGSHNWSNDGTVSNRDASLLFFDAEVAQYFAQIFDYDWSRTRARSAGHNPRLLRDGELAPPGTERAPFGDLFDDGRASFGAGLSVTAAKPAPAPAAFAVADDDAGDVLIPNGVDEDGNSIQPAGFATIAAMAAAIKKRGQTTLSPAVVAANARAGLESMGLPAGVTPGNLARAGWAVVYADDVPQSIKDQLRPLLAHREKAAGARYKELLYKRGESVRDWLTRHNLSFGSITPSRVPYHLLLVGSPASMSFEFQYLLDLEYSVGRLWFDDEALFANYAKSVVDYETAAAPATKKQVLYFGPSKVGDIATTLSEKELVTPLATGTAEFPAITEEWEFGKTPLVGTAAKKAALLDVLGTTRPTVLFSASHGLQCGAGAANQRARQGALVTGDWTGGVIDATKQIAASDIADDLPIHGLVAFLFACYGVGTPAVDQFTRDLLLAANPPPIAPEPFIAALPQRLLGHPKGGALAVIGHVERAWEFSIKPEKVDPQIQPFRNAIGHILAGNPVGEATQDLSTRYAVLSTELVGALAPGNPKPLTDKELVQRWLVQTDARNYLLLGDPAVKVRADEIRRG